MLSFFGTPEEESDSHSIKTTGQLEQILSDSKFARSSKIQLVEVSFP